MKGIGELVLIVEILEHLLDFFGALHLVQREVLQEFVNVDLLFVADAVLISFLWRFLEAS